MLFINFVLLAGLAAVSVPIIIHLLNRRSARVVDWGAMRFLFDSMLTRKRRIQLEEALLMAARCLLVALIALCVARPYVPPGSQVPWVVVLPLFLLGVAMAAVTTVMWPEKHLRWKLAGITVLLFALCGAAIAVEHWFNLKRFGTAGHKDIALVIDGSTSMTLKTGGVPNFDLALREAEKIISDAGRGTAFSLILGAPVPQAKFPQPVVNRADLKAALNSLKPVNGRMAAFDTLALAVVSLTQGNNPQKEIIVLTDGQDVGWELDRPARWEALEDGLAHLKSKPNLIIRQLPLPPTLRNLGVSNVRFSRQIVGTDRPVTIEVSVTNTGTEAVTPGGVELKVGGETLSDSTLSQMPPGMTETVRFSHSFAQAGAAVVTASVKVEDDIASDNNWDAVAEVQDKLRVLIVDGNPAGNFLERAGSFAALALAPGSLLKSQVQTANTQAAAKDLVDPEVRPITQLATLDGFTAYDAVILCDAPGLSPSSARQLAAFVEAGGGLLIAPGRRCNATFYNGWAAANGRPLLPVHLLQQTIVSQGEEEAKPALTTFSHEALRLVADARQSDLSSLIFTHYWKLGENTAREPGVYIGGRLGSGDPFLASRRLGRGVVVLLAASLDAEGSNLATRHSFVPLLHEIVYHLASPGGQRLNLQPAYTVNIPLSRARSSTGLRGEYFDNAGPADPLLSRIDPNVNFNWEDRPPAPGLPADGFRVRWSGSLIPKYTEEYTFMAQADDSIEAFVNDEQLIGNRRRKERISLVAGQPVALRVEFIESSGKASAKLYWQSSSQNREIVPTDALLPHAPAIDDAFESSGGSFEAIGPDGQPRRIELIHSRAGTSARLREAVVPGLYQIALPEARRAEFSGLLTKDGKLAFSIIPDADEGSIKPLGEEAFQFLRKYMGVLRPMSADDVLAILTGKQFGEELWKYLAVGALFLALCETALARWIAVQRQTGGETAIDFETRFQPRREFQDAIEELKKVA
ncbi:MAG: PA14 domain-containing protein [Verrucomicrobiales bacterium]